MGLHIGGPFAGAGGFTLGLLTGLITADSHYGGLNAQIQSEQQKDHQLEAAIEEELERQRALENQVTQTVPQSTGPLQDTSAAPLPTDQDGAPQKASVASRPHENVSLASITKQATSPPSTPFKNVKVRDINGDGVPDLWIYYNPHNPGEILRQEEATKSDGRVNSWSYFKDGQLVRRDVDTTGQGRPDIVFYYDGDKIAREERDESGRGHISYRAIYQNGRLIRVEKDTRGEGKIDSWIYYDTDQTEGIIAKDEKDLNGDGAVDLWTYYENGRVVRRDVSEFGLDYLTEQEKELQTSALPDDPIPIAPQS
ncbi:MAG: hypothetical protein GEU77_10010 [Deltaproteobacteria bacterium]|nr:hypothetical protein [Deltaproteobacteria bacterium]